VTAVARMAVLNLRTVAPYWKQSLGLLVVVAALSTKSPLVLLPALVLLITPMITAYPFLVADKAGLETLYAVLPVPRRSVLYGHYAWAMANYLVVAAAGTVLDFLLARVEGVAFSGRDFLTVLTLSWALFAINVAIQFPLLIRFGYTQVNVLATTLPLALILVVVLKVHLFPSIASVQAWLPLLGGAGVAATAASVAVAMTADRRRVRFGRPNRAGRTSGATRAAGSRPGS
jgi:hypothetical protein